MNHTYIFRQSVSRTPHLVEKNVSFVHSRLGPVEGTYLTSALALQKRGNREQDVSSLFDATTTVRMHLLLYTCQRIQLYEVHARAYT